MVDRGRERHETGGRHLDRAWEELRAPLFRDDEEFDLFLQELDRSGARDTLKDLMDAWIKNRQSAAGGMVQRELERLRKRGKTARLFEYASLTMYEHFIDRLKDRRFKQTLENQVEERHRPVVDRFIKEMEARAVPLEGFLQLMEMFPAHVRRSFTHHFPGMMQDSAQELKDGRERQEVLDALSAALGAVREGRRKQQHERDQKKREELRRQMER